MAITIGVTRADDDVEVIDLDAPAVEDTQEAVEDRPEPSMPENPYGKLSIEDIVRTGTLDGVNPPSTPEEQDVLNAMINFHTYSEATKAIDTSFDSLMEQLQMGDLSEMMDKMKEDMEAEFMAN